MMRAVGFEDMIQPQEQWDHFYSSIGFSNNPNPNSYPRPQAPVIDNQRSVKNQELSEWVEQITKQLIDDMPSDSTNTSDHHHHRQPTIGSSSCEDNSLTIPSLLCDSRPSKMMRLSYENVEESLSSWTKNDQQQQQQWHLGTNDQLMKVCNSNNNYANEQSGLSLITLLLECAVAISVDNLGEAHRMLLELTQMASPYGPSCAERVVAYFAKAMSSRVINSWLGISSPLINSNTVHSAFQVFNNVSPFVKFSHFTSNQAILEAFHRRDCVHIVDLDIMQGLQWPALFHILATRAEGPPCLLRMTGMGPSVDVLLETGKQLSNFAKRLGLSFEFHPVAKKFSDVVFAEDIHVRRGETLAVHWMQHSLYDATGADWKTLRLLSELSPRVVTLVEQEISHGGGGGFLDRFVGSLHYYSTLFDSLGAYFPSDDPNRHRVEHCILYKEINNVLAIGGPARSGEDKFRCWRSELGRSGFFAQVPMSGNSMAQAQLILNMFPPAHGYSLIQGHGTLMLGWKDTSLYTASSWTSPRFLSHASTCS